MRRIVVTGMGLVGPLGSGAEISWKRLLDGKSGIRSLPDEISNDLPVKIGGIVPSQIEDSEAGFDPDLIVDAKDQRKMDRFILFALAAAKEALETAGWHPTSDYERERTATIIASGIGGFPAIASAVRITDTRAHLFQFGLDSHFAWAKEIICSRPNPKKRAEKNRE